MAQPVTPITEAEVKLCDPAKSAPPLVRQDGHTHAVGEAHGRVIPLVGSTRPYLHSLAYNGTRIYADTTSDLLSLYLGAPYDQLLADLQELEDSMPPALDTPYRAPENPIAQIALGAAAPEEPVATDEELATFAAHQAAAEQQTLLLFRLALVRRRHADGIRVALQDKANRDAVANGQWDLLSDAQRDLLASAADPDGLSPAGVIEEVPVMVTDPDTGAVSEEIGERGVWIADVPLVVNTGDYAPWTDVPFPFSAVLRTGPNGQPVEVVTRSNLTILDIDTGDGYLESLNSAGVASWVMTPDEQADPWFQNQPDIPELMQQFSSSN